MVASAAAAVKRDVPIWNFEVKIIIHGVADNPDEIAREAYDMIVEDYPRLIDHELNVQVWDDSWTPVAMLIGRPA